MEALNRVPSLADRSSIAIDEAVALLRSGGVIGMPTETVYGLAADARNADAVARIFALKGRPSTNPLIVHVGSIEIAERYADVDGRARRLFDAFAPGPLTIVLPKRAQSSEASVCSAVTAGLDSVGIRIPAHPIALEVLRHFDGPIAAPSANLSNHVSPTTADHVRAEFGDAVPVLDGGACRVGLESTVLSLANDRPRLLRPGAVTQAQIESVIGPIERFVGHVSPTVAAVSPGQHEKHYAPRAPAFRFGRQEQLPSIVEGNVAVVVLDVLPSGWPESAIAVLRSLGDPASAARSLYATLREVDATSPDVIYVELPPDEPAWSAVRDRITRATLPMPR